MVSVGAKACFDVGLELGYSWVPHLNWTTLSCPILNLSC